MSPRDPISAARNLRRRSLYALVVGMPFFAAVLLVLWLLSVWVRVPPSVFMLVIAIGLFTMVGDLINLAYQSRCLRDADPRD